MLDNPPGRCSTESIDDAQYLRNASLPACVLLTGSLVITSQPTLSASPLIYLRRTSGLPIALSGSHRSKTPTHITTLTLDQSPPSDSYIIRLACFYDNGEFSIFLIEHTNPESSRRLISYLPQRKSERTAPIRQAAYHHPLLATLSEAFHLSLYNTTGRQHCAYTDPHVLHVLPSYFTRPVRPHRAARSRQPLQAPPRLRSACLSSTLERGGDRAEDLFQH